eukprot:TRINITY_DN75090_c0_g1_i1.p1 TRINITY_DN75090_c0_g1~~TRINITY_DN75090_c0_g1_i1.p1  ORF type:complete len:598 (-),score=93.15 TRINITY_DN75090_c0_g1_i1:88-1881(-)
MRESFGRRLDGSPARKLSRQSEADDVSSCSSEDDIRDLDWAAVSACGPKAAALEEAALRKVQGLIRLQRAAQSSLYNKDELQPSESVLCWETATALLTPEEFAWVMTILSAYVDQDESESHCTPCKQFLMSLSVEVSYETTKTLFQQRNPNFFVSRRLPESCYSLIVKDSFVPSHDDAAEREWPLPEADGSSRLWCWLPRLSRPSILRASFAYSGAWQLFEQSNTKCQVLVTEVLMNAPPSSGVFSTPVGRGINHKAWQNCYSAFLRERLCDLCMVFFLMPLSYYYRRSLHVPMWLCIVLGLLSLREICNGAVDAISFQVIYGNLGKVLSIVLNSWNGVVLVMQFYTAACLLHIFMGRDCVLKKQELSDCPMYRHPSAVSYLVLSRWAITGLASLSFRALGEHVLPCFYAITWSASLYFAMYLLIVIFGSFHAYYVYPISEHIAMNQELPDLLYSNFMTLLKIFRLEALGDFDLWEMEGQNEVIEGQISGSAISAEIDDPTPDSRVRVGLLSLFVVLSLSVTVITMNVYIGLLGSLYDSALKMQKLLHCQWRSMKILEINARRHFFNDILWQHCPAPVSHSGSGVWIVHSAQSLQGG